MFPVARCSVKGWLLVELIAGAFKAIGLALAGIWALHRMVLAALAARSLDRCASEVRSGALLLGALGWIAAGAGLVGASAARTGSESFIAAVSIGAAVALLALARGLVRRGSP